MRSFGENVHKSIKAMLFVNKIIVLSEFQISEEKPNLNGNILETLVLK